LTNIIIATSVHAAAMGIGVLFWWLMLDDLTAAIVAYLALYHVIRKGSELAKVMNGIEKEQPR
jgi:divalent metal cation (Fe/Co/Zn/Cd) transporter